jgi:hypothetical protein
MADKFVLRNFWGANENEHGDCLDLLEAPRQESIPVVAQFFD